MIERRAKPGTGKRPEQRPRQHAGHTPEVTLAAIPAAKPMKAQTIVQASAGPSDRGRGWG